MSAPPRPFPPWTTAFWALAWLWVMLHSFADYQGVEPLSLRAHPVASAQRMVNREIELATAADALTGISARLGESLHATCDDALANAIYIHWDLVDYLEHELEHGFGDLEMLARAQLQYALLLAESGDVDAAYQVAGLAHDGDHLLAILAALHDPQVTPTADVVDDLAARGIDDWLLERASLRVLDAERREAAARETLENSLARGDRWLRRSQALSFTSIACIVLGLALLLARLVRRDRPLALDFGTIAPWDLETGLGVLIRGDFWSQLILILIAQGTARFPDSFLLERIFAQAEPLAALPLLWLVYRHLLRAQIQASPTRSSPLRSFGLARASWQPKLFISVTFIAVAVDFAGSSLLGHLATLLGSEFHWAEGFDEMLIWGSSVELAESILDYMLWTPLVEELTFRGLLYFSLRRRFGATHAALLSATIFSMVHFYNLPGFLTTFWSGLVWALAFERTRSLWPGIVAHSIYNGIYVAGLVLIYR